MTPQELQTYMQGLATRAGLTDASPVNTLIAQITADTPEAKALFTIIDSAAETAVAAAQQQTELTKWRDEKIVPYVKRLKDRASDEEAKRIQTEELHTRFRAAVEAKYGMLTDLGDGTFESEEGETVKPADIQKLLDKTKAEAKNEASREFLAVQIDASQVRQMWAQHFPNTPLNEVDLWQEVHRVASAEDGRVISLVDAFKNLHGETIAKQQNDARQKELANARAEGAAEREKQILQRAPQLRGGALLAEADTAYTDAMNPKEGAKTLSDADRLAALAADLEDPALASLGAVTQ